MSNLSEPKAKKQKLFQGNTDAVVPVLEEEAFQCSLDNQDSSLYPEDHVLIQIISRSPGLQLIQEYNGL